MANCSENEMSYFLNINATLLDAAQKRRIDLVKTMLLLGANPNTVDVFGCTALMLLAASGCSKGVKYLLDDPECVLNKRDIALQTALHFATNYGHLQCVHQLLEKGAIIDVANDWGETPLIIAVKKGFEDIVLEFISRHANVEKADIRGFDALMYAAANGYYNILKILLLSGMDVNHKVKTTALHEAARHGHCDCVKELVAYGADKCARDIDGKLPVEVAIYTDKVEIVKILFCDEDSLSVANHLLATAMKHNAINVVTYLLNENADPYYISDIGVPIFFESIIYNSLSVVLCLLKNNFDLFCPVSKAFLQHTHSSDIYHSFIAEHITAVEAALILGYKSLVSILVSAGAPINGLLSLVKSNILPHNIIEDKVFLRWLQSLQHGPHPLAHCCRKLIRNHMKTCHQLTENNISRLPLPYCLHSYVAYNSL